MWRLRQCVALDVNLDARTQYLDPAVRRDSAREDTANAERAAGGDIAVRRKFLRCAKAESRIYARNESISRSEEHTSELQSLMRISYCVLCLTTKNKK